MDLLPIFVKLAGRRCLLVGAGNVALEKIGSLLPTGLILRVVAPVARPEIRELAAARTLDWVERRFDECDLDGNFIVIAATDAPEVNAAVYRGCKTRNIACNSVDDIPNCDFFFGSVVKRGQMQIAISTSGESPAVAQRLRREIDEQLPQDLGPWLETLGQLRREVLNIHPRSEERKLLMHNLARRSICESELCPSRQLAYAPLGSNLSPQQQSPGYEDGGKVFLVGAGPGDPDLLTVKALRIIRHAEVVLHDDLVADAVLALAPSTSEAINVGKRCGAKNITQDEINELMIEHARAGRCVVRLKSGDPLIFGRASEEIDALNGAQIAFEVIPGITAASAAAAAIGCSLTDRNSASNVIFSTGHHAQSHNHAPIPEVEDATRVVYMPGRNLNLLAEEWRQQGLPPELPCVIVSHAAQRSQQVLRTTLGQLGDAQTVSAPSLLLAGWAVGKSTAAALLDAHLEAGA